MWGKEGRETNNLFLLIPLKENNNNKQRVLGIKLLAFESEVSPSRFLF